MQTKPHQASGRQETATLRPVPQREIGVTGQFIDLTETRIRHAETYTPDRSHGPVQATTEIAPEITALCHGTLLTISLRYHDRTTRDLGLASPMTTGIESSYRRLDALLAS